MNRRIMSQSDCDKPSNVDIDAELEPQNGKKNYLLWSIQISPMKMDQKLLHQVAKYSSNKELHKILDPTDVVDKLIKTEMELNVLKIKLEMKEKETDEKPRKKTKKIQTDELWDKKNPEKYVNYLKTCLVDKVLNYQEIKKYDSTNISEYVVSEACKQLRNNRNALFSDCIQFGMMLCWAKNNVKQKFDIWLKENVSMSRRHAERYIKLVRLVDYPKFFRLSIDFSSFYDKVDYIILYIGCNEKEKKFWAEE